MQQALRPYVTAGAALVAASLIAVLSVAPPLPAVQVREIRLINVDTAASPLGDGTALIYGGSGMPLPGPLAVDSAEQLYLAPNGFTGIAEPAFHT
jgi:hypothetical protein